MSIALLSDITAITGFLGLILFGIYKYTKQNREFKTLQK